MRPRDVRKVRPVKPGTAQKKVWWSLFVSVLAIILAFDFYMHPHAYFGVDGSRFFYAWFGFAACIAIIVVSKSLGFFLSRPDSYYDGDEE